MRHNTQNITYITIRILKLIKEYIDIIIRIHNIILRIHNLQNYTESFETYSLI
jgi:hypothetical protein